MITRIGCGGFDIDNDTLIEEDGVLKVKNGGGGGGGGVLVVYAETDTETGATSLYSTWQEIHDAFLSSGAVVSDPQGSLVTAITGVGYIAPSRYVVESGGESYVTSTADGYPAAGSQ